MADDGVDAEDHIVRLAVLSQFSIHPGLQRQRFWIRDGFSRGNDGADRTEIVEAFGVAVLGARHVWPLPVSSGDVVADRVAEHGVENILCLGGILDVFANHDAELAFVVQLLRDGVDGNVLKGSGKCIWIFMSINGF